MRVPFSFLIEQFSDSKKILSAIEHSLSRCDFTLGKDLDRFEKTLAEYVGVKHAIGVGSGTDALALILYGLGIRSGDEVITAPNSFVATLGAIVQTGATPVFVDVLEDFTLNPEKIESAITEKTKAIMPVHWAGYSADLSPILELGKRYGVSIVEDACQALGGRYVDGAVGSFGIAGAFSFHPIKPLHVWGDAGVVVTSSDELASEIKLLRNHGLKGRDEVVRFGFNSRFDNLQAVVANELFPTLEPSIDRRRECAARYDEDFRSGKLADFMRVPPRDPKRKHAFHLYQVWVRRRDEIHAFLQSRGIESKVHYPIPLHLQPASKNFGYAKGAFPVTERQSEESITLPCHQFMTDEQVDWVILSIKEFYSR